GMAVLKAGGDLENVAQAVAAARALTPEDLADSTLRGDQAAQAASKVAAIPEVRATLLEVQRDFAARPPGAVLDGRDIGTVVCPDANIKLFVTASLEARALRRLRELQERGVEAIHDHVLQDMKERDTRDSQRSVAPLVAARDAFVLDTSQLDADAVFAAALEMISGARAV
ncbi:MAG: (d)CMP kinase, partial [Rhodospirillales bacterium]|nr:(d)CMP kinase [Rhodospirillales bacterium]